MINILYFAKVREELGLQSESESWSAEFSTVVGLLAHLIGKHDAQHLMLGSDNLVVSINHEVADASASIKDGDEVAFYPPVTGG